MIADKKTSTIIRSYLQSLTLFHHKTERSSYTRRISSLQHSSWYL